MAFKKRDNQNILNNTENDNNIIDENIKFSNNEEVKNYREDAIRTIEILEKKGINIYDENRYAGMYLKKEITDFHRLDKIFGTEENGDSSENLSNQNINFDKIFS
jgi:hypothetical protein|nr:MAG TPA: hypothetical protein [Caudoviricetes sp.]